MTNIISSVLHYYIMTFFGQLGVIIMDAKPADILLF